MNQNKQTLVVSAQKGSRFHIKLKIKKRIVDMYRPILLLIILINSIFVKLHSQETNYKEFEAAPPTFPSLAIKTNLLYNLTTTMNMGGEMKLSDYLTLDLSLSYNPWTFSNNRKFKHISVQPEIRYWIYEPYNGHFLGVHLLYSNFNVGNIKLPLSVLSGLNDYRYRGDAYGLGLSYGYQWILSPRWNLEATFGFGYLYLDYNRYECNTCGKKIDDTGKHYLGPTKVGVSLIYVIK